MNMLSNMEKIKPTTGEKLIWAVFIIAFFTLGCIILEFVSDFLFIINGQIK